MPTQPWSWLEKKKKLAISISSWMLNEFYAMCEVPVLNVQFVLVTGEII